MKITQTKRYTIYKKLVLQDPRSKKLDFNPDGKKHYVYRVTDYTRNEEKHYYGSRTAKLSNIIEDFWNYKTSSKYNILNESKKENYNVKILKFFNNPADKIIYEAFLHQYFNVRNSNSFWNKSNQTPFHFQVGKEARIKQKNTINSEEWKETIGKIQKEKYINKVNSKEWKENIGREKLRKTRETISKQEWKETIGREKIKKHEENMEKSFINYDGKITTKRKEASKKISGELHYNTKRIFIYSKENILMYTVAGSFKKFCSDNNLPIRSLRDSKDNNGRPLYQTKLGKSKANKNGNIKYEGWYAIERS